LDSADTDGSFNGSDVNVTSISPSGGPGVSDDVIALSILDSESDSGDGVIEAGSTLGGVHDTTGVTLEGSGFGINSHGDWSFSNSGEELSGRSWLNVVVVGNIDAWCGLVSFAGSSVSGSGGVWVLRFENLTVLGNVFHTLVLPSTLASVATGVAGNQLLFGEGEEVSTILNLLSRFDGGGGRESPA